MTTQHTNTMSEYMFGLGVGHLPKRVAVIARNHGAVLVNHCDPGCKCGYGCTGDCPECKRHWFAGPNRGEPFDSALARAVMSAITKATSNQ